MPYHHQPQHGPVLPLYQTDLIFSATVSIHPKSTLLPCRMVDAWHGPNDHSIPFLLALVLGHSWCFLLCGREAGAREEQQQHRKSLISQHNYR